MSLALRPYQLEAVEAVLKAETRGIQRQFIALPTGSGKTVCFAEVIRQRPGRALVLAHRDELIQQAVEKLSMVMPDRALEIGVVKAGADDHDAPIVVASVQTLSRARRLSRMWPDFQTVIIDEAHHARAFTYELICEYLGSFDAGGPLTLGVSATPERGDHLALGEIFEEIVYQKGILDLIPEYLCDLRALQITLAADFNDLHTRAGDFIDSEVEAALLGADAPQYVARAYYEHAIGRKAIIFTPTVKLAYAMVDAFREAGDVSIEGVDGETPLDARRAILRRFHTGETMIVANCAVLSEGFDEPSVDCIICARPTKSKVVYAQQIGRGTRNYPTKADCLVMDVVGVSTRFDLMTFAGLFDIPPQTGEATLTEVVAHQAHAKEAKAAEGRLVAQRVDLFRKRPLHWVLAGKGRFALSVGTGLVWLDSADGELWSVHYKSRERGRETLVEHLSMGYAQGYAEDYARAQGAGSLVDPDAWWRKARASAGQLDVLRRAKIAVKAGLTKGEASDLISAAAIDWT